MFTVLVTASGGFPLALHEAMMEPMISRGILLDAQLMQQKYFQQTHPTGGR